MSFDPTSLIGLTPDERLKRIAALLLKAIRLNEAAKKKAAEKAEAERVTRPLPITTTPKKSEAV